MTAQSIVFLPTADLKATQDFYQGLLGLELALDQGTCLIFKINDGAFWGFCQRAEPPLQPENTFLTFVTADVEGWYRELTERGIDTDGPPRLNPQYQITHFFAIEPNGYRLEVQRFEDPRWI